MAYTVTARKWRPRKFEEVVAQEHITTTLKNAILSDRIAQCYLLCGPRGVGKTTTARIIAKALNCEQRDGADPCNSCSSCESISSGTSLNVLEIDGASNNGVDDIRELREVVRYAATQGTYKIYIIDEVHMLSKPAFNALLKTLEEPPAHVVFVFATTEVQEVPDTILSRCQRYNFRRVGEGRIAEHLSYIAGMEGIIVEMSALHLIANRADGSLRDAESLFDQVMAFSESEITMDSVKQVLGLVDRKIYFEILQSIHEANSPHVLKLLEVVFESGVEVEEFSFGLLEVIRKLLFSKIQGSAEGIDSTEEDKAKYDDLVTKFKSEDLLRILQMMMDTHSQLSKSIAPRFRLEIVLVRMAMMGRTVDIAQLLAKVDPAEVVPGSTPDSLNRSELFSDSAYPERSQDKITGSNESAEKNKNATQKDITNKLSSEIDENKLRKLWPELVEGVKAVKPTLFNFLKEARILGIDRRTINLALSKKDSFQFNQVNKNKEDIERLLSEKFGELLKINLTQEPVLSGSNVNKEENSAGDPRDQSVLDAFDGELL